MQAETPLNRWSVARRQFAVLGISLLLILIVMGFLWQHQRQWEWNYRVQQSFHRLELGERLILQDLERVYANLLFLANQKFILDFSSHDPVSKNLVESELASFLRFHKRYHQIRLIDLRGRESVRVNLEGEQVRVVPESELQNKSERSYFREARSLQDGEIFVSKFDLNLEHGQIEHPPNPVIRFVTPVVGDDENDEIEFLLVANYHGATLLHELASMALPGATYLIRDDGQFLLGPKPSDGWGWQLGHNTAFADKFPSAWKVRHAAYPEFAWADEGAFAFRTLQMGGIVRNEMVDHQLQNNLTIVSHISKARAFRLSNMMLNRLFLITGSILVPMTVLSRLWAIASVRRQQQNQRIAQSEIKLRELSRRLVEIQEQERRAISREIHDQLGQQATAINLDLKMAQRVVESEAGKRQLARAVAQSEQLLETLQDFASRIRPAVLDDLGLRDALESHLSEFRERTGVAYEFEYNILETELPRKMAVNVFRIVQEALNNVAKHANATNVSIAVGVEDGKDHSQLVLQIKDNGDGVLLTQEDAPIVGNHHKNGAGLGLVGMQERTELLNGRLEVHSESNRGTTITVTIPWNGENNGGLI